MLRGRCRGLQVGLSLPPMKGWQQCSPASHRVSDALSILLLLDQDPLPLLHIPCQPVGIALQSCELLQLSFLQP